jgi:murein DD-endopeptidase MepM/ murein hydrolase activator NlpD
MALRTSSFFFVTLCALLCTNVDADPLLTDQSPLHVAQTGAIEQVTLRHTQPRVLLQERGARNKPVFYALNLYNGPVQVELTLEHGLNVSTDHPMPARFTIPSQSEMPTIALWPAHRQRLWSYQYSYRYVVGDPTARHQPLTPYRPPFPPGQSYRVSQGFHSRYSHNTSDSRYAVDISMPEGTPVHAARAGVVMELTTNFDGGGLDREKYGKRANLIRILHDDGTMAVYAHLQHHSNRVTPGTRVAAGQVIAASGNTGYTSGPHLHFVVQRNAGMHIEAVPFQFVGLDDAGITPREGMILAAR